MALLEPEKTKELCRHIAQHLRWSGMSIDTLARTSGLAKKQLEIYADYGNALETGVASDPPSNPQEGTRDFLIPHLWHPSALWMRELSDALISKLKPKKESEKGPVVAVVGAGLSEWTGVETCWAELGLDVLGAAANASGVGFNVPEAALRGNFYRSLWRSLSEVARDVGLPPRTEASARAGLMKLLGAGGAQRRVETQHLCAAVWQNEGARADLAALIDSRFAQLPLVNVPGLGNEILAHLVDAGLVDHVVSANIDDSLDRSFDLEIGPGNYHRLLSDKAELTYAGGSRPCLVKLHGSMRPRSTVNFDSTLGGRLSHDMTSLLDRMVWGQDPSDNVPKMRVISLGYGWGGGALARWVRSRAEHLERIYVVRRGHSPYEELLPLGEKCSVISLGALTSQGDKDGVSIGEFLWALWEQIQGTHPRQSAPPPRPKGGPAPRVLKDKVPNIARHLILACLFALPAPGDRELGKHCCRNNHSGELRLFADVLLHLIKCKGMLNAHAMAADPRLSLLFDEARRLDPELSPPAFVLRHSSATPVTSEKAFLLPSRSPFAGDTYFSTASDIRQLAASFWKGLSRGTPDAGNDKIRCPRLVDGRIVVETTSVGSFIEQQVEAMFDGSDVEVRRDGDARLNWMFSAPEPIESHTELWARVETLVMSGDWSDLLVITEWSGRHARMLENLDHPEQKRRILIIEPSRFSLEPWKLRDRALQRWSKGKLVTSRAATSDKNPKVFMLQVPWYRHHQHFTLAIRNGKPVEATFARRFLKASVIAPIATKSLADCVELLVQFVGSLRYVRSDRTGAPSYQDDAPHSSGVKAFTAETLDVARSVCARLGGTEAARLEAVIAEFSR